MTFSYKLFYIRIEQIFSLFFHPRDKVASISSPIILKNDFLGQEQVQIYLPISRFRYRGIQNAHVVDGQVFRQNDTQNG
jgi:hypothetical protein